MIELYGNASPNVAKIIFMLEEVELPYRQIWVNQYKDEQFTSDYLLINPNAKVPAIIDMKAGRHPVFESGAILIYLAEKTGKLLPSYEPARSTVLSWLMVQVASVGPIFGQFNHFAKSDYSNEVVPYAKNRFENEAHRILAMIEHHLGSHTYFGGEALSIADLAMYPWMCLLDFIGLPGARLDSLRRWRDLLAARPTIANGLERWEEAKQRTREQRLVATDEQLDRYFGRTRRVELEEVGYPSANR